MASKKPAPRQSPADLRRMLTRFEPDVRAIALCWIMPAKAHVTLGFNYGAELPDPKGLLEGTGILFRHVKLVSEADVDGPALRRLLEAATCHRVPPPVSLG